MCATCSVPGCPVGQPISWDENWREKIQLARDAGDLGRKLRKGKSTSFRRAIGV